MEEDIKILEDFKTVGYTMLLTKYGDRKILNLHLERAIENLIKGYRELKERNIYLVNERKKLEELLFMSNENYIEKSKAKEKIEELKKELTNEITKNDGFAEYREYAIDILEELMEDKLNESKL